MLSLIVGMQLLTILVSQGNMYVLAVTAVLNLLTKEVATATGRARSGGTVLYSDL